ncbi:MAG: hypothetical protein QXE31_02315 [Candidatus Woesearchaeota archaeon]
MLEEVLRLIGLNLISNRKVAEKYLDTSLEIVLDSIKNFETYNLGQQIGIIENSLLIASQYVGINQYEKAINLLTKLNEKIPTDGFFSRYKGEIEKIRNNAVILLGESESVVDYKPKNYIPPHARRWHYDA